jgi:site-specific DNA-adenine methylase
MPEMKRIGPFFGYYGAKYKSAGRYPKPEKPLIIEPFGGAAGYSVFHYWHNVEIYDINPRVFGVWDYLNKVSSSEFLKVKFRIAGELRYIRHWKISNKSYQEIENKDACWYIDPPYHRSGSLYTFKDIDYSHLARWSMERMGRVMVCEQKGADWLPFRSFIKITGVQSRKNPTVSEEVIWTNW